MVSISRIILNISAIIFAFGLYGCVDDEEVRLPTDVIVEGREMFNTSFAISEHLNLLLIPYDRYIALENDTVPLPGCPNVAINQEDRTVTLTFNPEEPCANSTLRRSGSISLLYTTSLITNEEILLVEYPDYSVINMRIEGSRLINKLTGTDLDIYKDNMAQLMLYDEFGSSTRLTAEYEHQYAIGADSTRQINTGGAGRGRNLAGRQFSFTIDNPKVQYERCIEEGIYVYSSGRETWNFERTVTAGVTHRMNFGESSECDRNVTITLSNGETLILNP